MNYKKKTIILIAIATIVRCAIAYSIELGNDEVYYRMYAQYLQWNYFDHPPMVGWLIRFTTSNLLLDNEFFIRLGAIASAAVTTWLLFLSGKKLNSDYTGFLAAFIYTATIYGSIIAGTFILPDSPQMVCWSGALLLLIGTTENSQIGRVKKYNVVCFGLIAGLGMLCKIHTSFLWFGFLLYIVLYNREWIRQPALYISGIITLLFFYPVIKWNIDNHFITYLYHSNRVNVATGRFNISSFLTFALGQVLYTNPIAFLFIILATIAALKNKLPVLLSQNRLLLCCSLPLIGVASALSLFNNVLPHWTGPAYSGLILLTASYFSLPPSVPILLNRLIPASLKIATMLLVTVIIGGVFLIHFLPGTLGKKDDTFLGEGDFTLDLYGWHDLKKGFEKIVESDLQLGTMKKDAAIISNKWFPAAHIDYYVSMPLKKDLIVMGDISDIHQYAWINKKRKALNPGDDAYCIVPSENNISVSEWYAAIFKKILPPDMIEQKRNGKACRKFYIYKLKGYSGK